MALKTGRHGSKKRRTYPYKQEDLSLKQTGGHVSIKQENMFLQIGEHVSKNRRHASKDVQEDMSLEEMSLKTGGAASKRQEDMSQKVRPYQ
jgi:hypothetical protein